jgi:hypothetical protein
VGALGADRAGETGAHPGQVVSAIIPARQVGGRVVLTSCRRGGRGGYGRVGSGMFLSLGGIGRARCNNESIADRLRRFTQLGVLFWAQLPHPCYVHRDSRSPHVGSLYCATTLSATLRSQGYDMGTGDGCGSQVPSPRIPGVWQCVCRTATSGPCRVYELVSGAKQARGCCGENSPSSPAPPRSLPQPPSLPSVSGQAAAPGTTLTSTVAGVGPTPPPHTRHRPFPGLCLRQSLSARPPLRVTSDPLDCQQSASIALVAKSALSSPHRGYVCTSRVPQAHRDYPHSRLGITSPRARTVHSR